MVLSCAFISHPCWVYWMKWRHVIEFVLFRLLPRYRQVYNYLAVIVSP